VLLTGTKVVDNNFYQGLTTQRDDTVSALAPGAMDYFEGAAANGLDIRYTPQGGNDRPSDISPLGIICGVIWPIQ